MLSIGKLSLGQEAYYLNEVLAGAEDYYVHAGEAPGRWTGNGTTGLGLDGEVDADQLRAVLAGNHPGSGDPLRATRAALPGLDLTLSAPKSVSLVWGLGNDQTAATVVACHERAVDAAVSYLERHACRLRRGHDGLETTAGEGFIAAAFRHRTSRLGDPSLHTHVLVANMAKGEDGRWTALDARPLFRHGRTAGFVYQAVLRSELAQHLGLLFDEVDAGHAEVAGIPADLRREFSQRRRQIIDELERHGVTSAKAAQAATLETRVRKSEHLPEDVMREQWRARAAAFGVDIATLPTYVRTPTVDVADEPIAAAVTESSATFDRRDVVRVVAQQATQGADLDQLESRADEFLRSEHAIEVAEGRWTTPEILRLESATVEIAVSGRATRRGLATDTVADAVAERPSLGQDQVAAVEAATTSGDAVTVIIGPAGTGKTFCLDAARDSWERSGHRVVGVALAARAAAQLQAGAGIRSETADRFLNGLAAGTRRLDERTVVVVDEAGMIGTRRLAAVIAEADLAAAKVVLVGDPKQLPEIEAGGLFASLADRLGATSLTVNRRQRDPHERAAVDDLRRREPAMAMARLTTNGNVTTADNAEHLRDALVRDWHEARARGEEVVMVAAHRSSVDDLNQRARSVLQSRGEIGADVLVTDERAFAVGDEVIGTRNRYDLGILNGQRGVVVAATDKTLGVHLDDGRHVELPADYIADDLAHGYATTVHKAQGLTVDRAYVLGDDSFTLELGYTSLTRGRDRNQVYLVAPERDDGHGLAPTVDPVAAFTDALARSGAETAAIDLIDPPALDL